VNGTFEDFCSEMELKKGIEEDGADGYEVEVLDEKSDSL